jgi:acetate kinase
MNPTAFLTVNAGSSSIRLDLLQRRRGRLARVATSHKTAVGRGKLTFLRGFIHDQRVEPQVVLHRIVHGGGEVSHGIFDAAMRRRLLRASALDPLHVPVSLAWIGACKKVFGEAIPQICIFDSAFFADLPPSASDYALPRATVHRLRLRRLGFHGLAHQSMLRQLREHTGGKGRVITLQLGSGCSAAAIKDGAPLDTSMGFTPLEGLVMGTRCGDVDPGLLLYLLKSRAIPLNKLEAVLNRKSGLLGLAGTIDAAELCKRKDPIARHALAVFSHRARKYIGAYAATLGGLDAIAIAGGIGEHSPRIRAEILGGSEWLGLELDRRVNAKVIGRVARISSASSRVKAWVLPVDEAEEMVRAAMPVLSRR